MTDRNADMRHILSQVQMLTGGTVMEAETEAQFFWGSRKPFRVGQILQGRTPRHTDSASRKVEALFRMIPVDDPFKRDCVYMVTTPDSDLIERAGGYANFIYQLEPQGEVRRYDVSWWAKVLSESEGGPPARKIDEYQHWVSQEIAPLVLAYYQGKATERPNWEYCCASARIVADVTGR